MYAWLFWASALTLVDLQGHPQDPFSPPARAHVFLFVRTDCPITNRYAPEWRRIMDEFAPRGVHFTLVYPDRSTTPGEIRAHTAEYSLTGRVLLDPEHRLAHRAHVTVTPETAVFDTSGRETYRGRIDDLYISPGKSRPSGPRRHDLELAIEATLQGKPVREPVTTATGCSLADVR
jgi:hypothetical protein